MNKQVVVLSSLVIFASSHARSIYISSSINKFQEQTTGIIYETISEGFRYGNSGDTLWVMPGTYGRTMLFKKNDINNKKMVIRSYFLPVIESVDGNNRLKNLDSVASCKGFDVRSDFVVLQGFNITDIGNGVGAINLHSVNNIEIRDNFIHELGCLKNNSGGIRARGENSDIQIASNTFWRVEGVSISICGKKWIVENNEISHGTNLTPQGYSVVNDADAIRFFGEGHLIKGNYIHDYIITETDGSPHMDAFQTYSVNPGEYARNIRIEGNYCRNIDGQFFMGTDKAGENNVHTILVANNIMDSVNGYAIYIIDVDTFTLVHNIITRARLGSMAIRNGSNHLKIFNNIFYKNLHGPQFFEESTLIGTSMDYNLHYPSYTYGQRPEFDKHGLFGIDPLFTSNELNRIELNTASPAINRGLFLEYIKNDFSGTRRPLGKSSDIGPYELN